MNHPQILALGYSSAAMFLRGEHGSNVRAIISIHGAREFPVDAPPTIRRLVLEFDDVESPNHSNEPEFHRTWVRQKWEAQMGRPLTAPAMDHARAIIEFARSIRETDGIVLCQCGAGMSRSPAAALLCLAEWTGQGQEKYCVAKLSRLRPQATPLLSLVRFGDEALGRNGNLTDALLAHQRNTDRH